MTIDERLRKFLLIHRNPVGPEFSDREVRESIRVFMEGIRNEELRYILIKELLLLIFEHLAEEEG